MRELRRHAAPALALLAGAGMAAVLVLGGLDAPITAEAPSAVSVLQPDHSGSWPATGGDTSVPRLPDSSPSATASPSPSTTAAGTIASAGATPAPSAPGRSNTAGPPPTVTCTGNQVTDTARLTNAIASPPRTGVVTIGPGTCALDNNLPLHSPITIQGAGPQATFIVQHAPDNIFQVTSPYVTVEDLNLNTATYNSGFYAQGTGGSPAVLFSAQSHTSVINVTAEVGDGFGMRITGPSPCAGYGTTGTVVTNLTISNAGNGGRAALDIDCTDGAVLTGITIPTGNYIALFQDRNVSLSNETYTPWSTPCHEPWYITGPSSNITISGVTGGGHGIVAGPTSNITLINQVLGRGC